MKREVAELLRVKPRTIDMWAQSGRLKVFKAGRLNRYRIQDVERCIGLPPGTLKPPAGAEAR